MKPLAGADAQIVRLVQQVIAIGRHRRSFTALDVARVVSHHFGGEVHRRETDRLLQRAERAEAELVKLREHLMQQPDTDLPPRKIVHVSRSEYEAFCEFSEGKRHRAIAAELGLAVGTVSNAIQHVTGRLGADTPGQAAAMVNRRVVVIRSRPGRRAA